MMDNTWGSVAEEALNHSTSIKKYSKYKEANSLFINFALSSLASFNPISEGGAHCAPPYEISL